MIDEEYDRFVHYLPDPDTEPDPYFEGMCWEEIAAELDRLEHEVWEREWLDAMWRRQYGWDDYGL